MSDRRPIGRIAARWYVISSLVVTPTSLFDIVLQEDEPAVGHLSVETPDCEADLSKLQLVLTPTFESLEDSKIVDFRFEVQNNSVFVRFTPNGKLNSDFVSGHIKITHPDHPRLKATVPYRLAVKEKIRVRPPSLRLVAQEKKFAGQLVVQTDSDVAPLGSLELSLINESADGAKLSITDGNPENYYVAESRIGMLILDLSFKDQILEQHFTHLELKLGDYPKQQIPIVFP